MACPKKQFRTLTILFLICVQFLSPLSYAYTVPDNTIVYVTDTGECYHREGCSYLRSSNALSIKEAEQKDYRACSRCHPNYLTGVYKSTKQQKEQAEKESKELSAKIRRKLIFTSVGIGFISLPFIIVRKKIEERKADAAALERAKLEEEFRRGELERIKIAKEAMEQRRAEEKKRAIMSLKQTYNQKLFSEVFRVPDGFTLGEDENPVRIDDPSDEFTVYITRTGKAYHASERCGGSKKFLNKLWEAQDRGLCPCMVCYRQPYLDMTWYTQYKEAKETVKKMGMEMVLRDGIIYLNDSETGVAAKGVQETPAPVMERPGAGPKVYMKGFSYPHPLAEILIKCPKNGAIYQAIVHAFYTEQKKPEIFFVKCHRFYECAACRQCLSCISLMYHYDEEPDFYEGPLDPLVSPRWRDAEAHQRNG